MWYFVQSKLFLHVWMDFLGSGEFALNCKSVVVLKGIQLVASGKIRREQKLVNQDSYYRKS